MHESALMPRQAAVVHLPDTVKMELCRLTQRSLQNTWRTHLHEKITMKNYQSKSKQYLVQEVVQFAEYPASPCGYMIWRTNGELIKR